MPTLRQLRQAHRRTGDALREADDRLGQHQEAAQRAVREQYQLELRSLVEDVPEAELATARERVSAARAALAAVRDELKPHLSDEVDGGTQL